MSDKVRQRKAIFTKLDEDRELNLDGIRWVILIYIEQDELLSYMRDDLIKQRKTWKVSFCNLLQNRMYTQFY